MHFHSHAFEWQRRMHISARTLSQQAIRVTGKSETMFQFRVCGRLASVNRFVLIEMNLRLSCAELKRPTVTFPLFRFRYRNLLFPPLPTRIATCADCNCITCCNSCNFHLCESRYSEILTRNRCDKVLPADSYLIISLARKTAHPVKIRTSLL